MFEKREKTPTSNARNGSQPSLEAAMALQKMFEEGRFEQVLGQLDDAGENLASPVEVSPPVNHVESVHPSDAPQSVPGSIGGFFRNLAQKLHLSGRKRPIGGKSVGGNG